MTRAQFLWYASRVLLTQKYNVLKLFEKLFEKHFENAGIQVELKLYTSYLGLTNVVINASFTQTSAATSLF